jgi:xylulokinase
MQLSGGVVLSEKLIVGLDFGTSSVKAIFINEVGDVLERVEVKIATISAEPGLAEQRAEDYLDALRSIADFNKDLTRNLIAIGVSGHTPSVVCIDESGTALRPVLTWQDTRAQKESQELQEVFGNPLEVIGTSLPWSPSACPAKLLWLSRNESWLVQKVRWVLQPKDYVGFHLTGEAISDPWSSKGLCNVITRKPIESLLKYLGWPTSIVPELRDGYSSRGNVSQAAASAFGFPSGIPVSTGWSDAMSGMVAIDVMREPSSFFITGTSAIVGSSTHTPPKDGGSLYLIPETCAPLTITYGPTQSSGSSIAWACDFLDISLDEVMSFSHQSEGKNLPIYLPYIYMVSGLLCGEPMFKGASMGLEEL